MKTEHIIRLEDYVSMTLEPRQLSIISTVFVLVTGTLSLLCGVVLQNVYSFV